MKFSEIYGRDDIIKRLKSSINENRVSHAQLFLGGEGNGKLEVAIAYAQYLNCTNRTHDDSCGACPSCVKYQKIAHPDLHFIFPVAQTKEFEGKKPQSKLFLQHWRKLFIETKAHFTLNDWYNEINIENKQGTINVEDCNDIIKTLNYKSFESEYKVMIIWHADKIFHAAAPKILKILEEPPEKTLFILITENSDLMLKTILSRTQIIFFKKRNNDEFALSLSRYTNCDSDKANEINVIANGNINKGIELYAIKDGNNEYFTLFRTWMRLCYSNKTSEIVDLSTEFQKLGREKQKHFFYYASEIMRNCIQNQFIGAHSIHLNNDELEFVKNFSPFVNQANIKYFANNFNNCSTYIERNGNPNLIFMSSTLKITKWLKLKQL